MLKPPKLFLERVDDLIIENLNDPNLLYILAKNLHLSSSQVYRKIKQKSGYAPSRYIRKKRLYIAKKWLDESDIYITGIAYQVGFHDLPYFSRCFLEEFGLPPQQYRKQQEANKKHF